MKTIRDYINLVENAQSQVDEMDRRSFLKGAGAAAVAGAVGAGAYMNRGKSNFEGNDGVYVDNILALRLALTTMHGGDTEKDLARTNQLIKRYLQANPKARPALEAEWKLISKIYSDVQARDGSGYDELYKVHKNKERILSNFEKFLGGEDPEFNPKVKGEFDNLEETSDEAIARVEQLAKR